MITLKELVQNQTWNDATDLQIIKAYFELNDLEADGIAVAFLSSDNWSFNC